MDAWEASEALCWPEEGGCVAAVEGSGGIKERVRVMEGCSVAQGLDVVLRA